MPERRRTVRTVATAVLATGLAVGLLVPASGQDVDPLADDDPVDLGAFAAPVRVEAPEGAVIELGSGRRLVDTLELRPSPVGDGLVVVAEMGLEDYVAGIAEMPARWPMEALKAQAVAARTYAWFEMAQGSWRARGLPYDICATTSCQVFRGHEVVEGPFGDRWARAVAETAGQVLVHDGGPALARYFSTSGGATRDNEDVFPSSGSYPYLRGVEDPDDAISPFHEWQVVFDRDDFDALLARGDTLAVATPVADVEVVQVPDGRPDRVVVTGTDGTVAEVTAGQLQAFLNSLAPELHPDRYPGPRRDGGRLPTTVPTTRYTVEVTDDRVVLDGSGWGHAVGLGQYGARGKAQRGMDHVEILATYYNGLRPVTTPDTPDRIRVGLADDVDELAIRAEGPVTVRAGDTVLTTRAFGDWRAAAADGAIDLVAPPGTGAPLVAATTTTPRTRPFPVEVVTVETAVSRPAELVVEVRSGDELLGRRSLGVHDRGRHTADVALATVADGAPLAPGPHAVALVAVDEDGSRAGAPASIEVLPVGAGTMASALAGQDPLPAPDGAPPVVPALLGLGAGAVAGVTIRRRVEDPS